MAELEDPLKIYRESLASRRRAIETHPPTIERAEVWPYPDLQRLWVRLQISVFSPFPARPGCASFPARPGCAVGAGVGEETVGAGVGGETRFPNLALTISGPEGEVVSSMFVVEAREPYQSLTMHLRQPPRAGERYALDIELGRDEQVLDTRRLEFDLVYREPQRRGS